MLRLGSRFLDASPLPRTTTHLAARFCGSASSVIGDSGSGNDNSRGNKPVAQDEAHTSPPAKAKEKKSKK